MQPCPLSSTRSGIPACPCASACLQGSNKMQLGMQVLQQDPVMEGEAWNEVSPEAKEVIR